jgi:hypothetical protein
MINSITMMAQDSLDRAVVEGRGSVGEFSSCGRGSKSVSGQYLVSAQINVLSDPY